MEIEIPAKNPRVISRITRHDRPILQLKTVLFTLYYPVSGPPQDCKDGAPAKVHHAPSRQLWLGRPRLGIAYGYSKFASLPWVGMPVFLPVYLTKLPAWRNGPISSQKPKHDIKAESDHDHHIEAKYDRLCDPPPDEKPVQFPVIIFSHGLGGTRTMYSSLCGEVSSSATDMTKLTDVVCELRLRCVCLGTP